LVGVRVEQRVVRLVLHAQHVCAERQSVEAAVARGRVAGRPDGHAGTGAGHLRLRSRGRLRHGGGAVGVRCLRERVQQPRTDAAVDGRQPGSHRCGQTADRGRSVARAHGFGWQVSR